MKTLKGEAAFDKYFESVYGERWQEIKSALLEKDEKVARSNQFFAFEKLQSLGVTGLGRPLSYPEKCFEINEDFDQSQLTTILLPFYRMDPASIVAARALEVQPGEKILDMCAAPGGKTLVLMEDLTRAYKGRSEDTTGHLTANELSAKRRHRMMSVFKRHLPPEVRKMISVRGVDASRIGLERKEVFDRILLDAPCSGERGLVKKKSELEGWKEKRTKSFGIRQYALLSSAFMALKPGGRIVYSTCSISPHENDAVIAKLRKRQGESFKIITPDLSKEGESTEFGTQFLPDRQGWGPIFFSVIEKSP